MQSAPATYLPSLTPRLNRTFGIVLEIPAAFLAAFASRFRSTLFVSRKVSGPTTILSHSVFLFEIKKQNLHS